MLRLTARPTPLPPTRRAMRTAAAGRLPPATRARWSGWCWRSSASAARCLCCARETRKIRLRQPIDRRETNPPDADRRYPPKASGFWGVAFCVEKAERAERTSTAPWGFSLCFQGALILVDSVWRANSLTAKRNGHGAVAVPIHKRTAISFLPWLWGAPLRGEGRGVLPIGISIAGFTRGAACRQAAAPSPGSGSVGEGV